MILGRFEELASSLCVIEPPMLSPVFGAIIFLEYVKHQG